MRKLIVVEGLPCSGKSTTGKYIGEQLGMKCFDENSGVHPADYEFQAFLSREELGSFLEEEQGLLMAHSLQKPGGYIIPLDQFEGELFEKLLNYKIYDFLPWEIEKPVMLAQWRTFAESVEPGEGYVFNSVLLQNPMCETMMRFGFDSRKSAEYIGEICRIIRPLDPFVIYLKNDDVRGAVEKAVPERGTAWLQGVIEYHCWGRYGKEKGLKGFEGYIAALEERQAREIEILQNLEIEYMILNNPGRSWKDTYQRIMARLRGESLSSPVCPAG